VSFVIPANLAAATARDELAERRAWLAALPGVVEGLAGRWSLELGAPFQPGGQCSWVAPARDAAGRDLVLKVMWRHPEAAHEVDGLRLWAGNGAVVVHAADVFDETSTLLLERCVPGTPLSEVAAAPEQDEVVAGLLRRLWVDPRAGHPFRPLQVMCDEWAAEFEAKLPTAPGTLDPGLARAGVELFRGLPATGDRSVVLITDLHAGNILAAQREPWLVIDPKPYVGDPTYDSLQHLLNCPDRLSTDPISLVRRLAALLDLDADRLVLWLFARCVVESLDWPALHDVAVRLAQRT
jgi:streptomycin 6-kinase